MSKALDLVGKRFGKLVVVSRAESDSAGLSRWNCKCDCGNECVVRGSKLMNGHTSSCGCIRRSTGFPSDLTGLTFGRLTVIKRDSDNGFYICKCSCKSGKLVRVHRRNLVNGHSQSCGCLKSELTSINNTNDLTGKTFSRLTVLHRVGSTEGGIATWMCKCECGNTIVVPGSRLVNGVTKSCGCFQREVRIATHTKWVGEEKEINKHFRSMKQRCYDKNSQSYYCYGAKGVYICDEWLKDPRKFVEWAKQNGFSPELTIGRINKPPFDENQDGPYAPWNCRWETVEEQANNKTTNVFLNIFGMDKTISQWSKEMNMPYRSFYNQNKRDPERTVMEVTSEMFLRSMSRS